MSADAVHAKLLKEMTPLLIEVQCTLDQELNLEGLARRYGFSPFHFHRLFSQAVGETPKKYVERLRLEKAAYKLQITDETVLNIALSVGFKNHETFSRAFKRHFDVAPRGLRKQAKLEQSKRVKGFSTFQSEECFLSAVRFESLRSMPLLAIRHLGDYYKVPDAFTPQDPYWNGLVAWARRHRIGYQLVPLGIFYDNPEVTPKLAQRCDACIPIDRVVAPRGEVRTIEFTGGKYGVIEHIGPYATLGQAFQRLADGILASDKYAFRDGPAVEIFRRVHIDGNRLLNHTDVYLPVERKSK